MREEGSRPRDPLFDKPTTNPIPRYYIQIIDRYAARGDARPPQPWASRRMSYRTTGFCGYL
jgi:hypothetical protein